MIAAALSKPAVVADLKRNLLVRADTSCLFPESWVDIDWRGVLCPGRVPGSEYGRPACNPGCICVQRACSGPATGVKCPDLVLRRQGMARRGRAARASPGGLGSPQQIG